MLAQGRRRHLHLVGGQAEVEQNGRDLDLAHDGVVYLPVKLPGFQLGAFGQLSRGLHEAKEDSGIGRLGEQFPFAPVFDGIQHNLVQLCAVESALGGFGETGLQQLRGLEEL